MAVMKVLMWSVILGVAYAAVDYLYSMIISKSISATKASGKVASFLQKPYVSVFLTVMSLHLILSKTGYLEKMCKADDPIYQF